MKIAVYIVGTVAMGVLIALYTHQSLSYKTPAQAMANFSKQPIKIGSELY